jgi:hypothetical protein
MAGPGRVSLWATRGPGPFCCSAPKAALRSPGARSGSRARTPAAAVTTAALAAEALARLRSTSRTQRKPMLLFLLPGAFLLRLAARKFLVSLLNEPPRNTRTLDRTPFPERELPKDLLPAASRCPRGPRGQSTLELRDGSGPIPPRRARSSASERILLRNGTTFARTRRFSGGVGGFHQRQQQARGRAPPRALPR